MLQIKRKPTRQHKYTNKSFAESPRGKFKRPEVKIEKGGGVGLFVPNICYPTVEKQTGGKFCQIFLPSCLQIYKPLMWNEGTMGPAGKLGKVSFIKPLIIVAFSEKVQWAYLLSITLQLSDVILPDVQTPHTHAQTHPHTHTHSTSWRFQLSLNECSMLNEIIKGHVASGIGSLIVSSGPFLQRVITLVYSLNEHSWSVNYNF